MRVNIQLFFCSLWNKYLWIVLCLFFCVSSSFTCIFLYCFFLRPCHLQYICKEAFRMGESCRKMFWHIFRRGFFQKDDEGLNYACILHYATLLLSHVFSMLLLENNYRVQRMEVWEISIVNTEKKTKPRLFTKLKTQRRTCSSLWKFFLRKCCQGQCQLEFFNAYCKC